MTVIRQDEQDLAGLTRFVLLNSVIEALSNCKVRWATPQVCAGATPGAGLRRRRRGLRWGPSAPAGAWAAGGGPAWGAAAGPAGA